LLTTVLLGQTVPNWIVLGPTSSTVICWLLSESSRCSRASRVSATYFFNLLTMTQAALGGILHLLGNVGASTRTYSRVCTSFGNISLVVRGAIVDMRSRIRVEIWSGTRRSASLL
ncbi:hypothetical protein KCU91_g81, partial [Aureobasidium melanogenum]